MKSDTRERARRQLDTQLSRLNGEGRPTTPPKGWIRAIRNALGMSGRQLAARLGVRPQSIDAMEKSEARGKISLETLRRAADALDCTLVYALVPKTSLEDSVRRRARRIAQHDLRRAAHSMALEDQATSDSGTEARIEDYIRNVLKDRDLWNGP